MIQRSFEYSGNKNAAMRIKQFALKQSLILGEHMAFQNLSISSRQIRFDTGEIIYISRQHSFEHIHIFSPTTIESPYTPIEEINYTIKHTAMLLADSNQQAIDFSKLGTHEAVVTWQKQRQLYKPATSSSLSQMRQPAVQAAYCDWRSSHVPFEDEEFEFPDVISWYGSPTRYDKLDMFALEIFVQGTGYQVVSPEGNNQGVAGACFQYFDATKSVNLSNRKIIVAFHNGDVLTDRISTRFYWAWWRFENIWEQVADDEHPWGWHLIGELPAPTVMFPAVGHYEFDGDGNAVYIPGELEEVDPWGDYVAIATTGSWAYITDTGWCSAFFSQDSTKCIMRVASSDFHTETLLNTDLSGLSFTYIGSTCSGPGGLERRTAFDFPINAPLNTWRVGALDYRDNKLTGLYDFMSYNDYNIPNYTAIYLDGTKILGGNGYTPFNATSNNMLSADLRYRSYVYWDNAAGQIVVVYNGRILKKSKVFTEKPYRNLNSRFESVAMTWFWYQPRYKGYSIFRRWHTYKISSSAWNGGISTSPISTVSAFFVYLSSGLPVGSVTMEKQFFDSTELEWESKYENSTPWLRLDDFVAEFMLDVFDTDLSPCYDTLQGDGPDPAGGVVRYWHSPLLLCCAFSHYIERRQHTIE